MRDRRPVFLDEVALQHGEVEVQLSLQIAVVAAAKLHAAEVAPDLGGLTLDRHRPGVVVAPRHESGEFALFVGLELDTRDSKLAAEPDLRRNRLVAQPDRTA